MSPQSEAYICGAQELVIFTKWHEKNILKNAENDTCQVCRVETETTFYTSISRVVLSGKFKPRQAKSSDVYL